MIQVQYQWEKLNDTFLRRVIFFFQPWNPYKHIKHLLDFSMYDVYNTKKKPLTHTHYHQLPAHTQMESVWHFRFCIVWSLLNVGIYIIFHQRENSLHQTTYMRITLQNLLLRICLLFKHFLLFSWVVYWALFVLLFYVFRTEYKENIYLPHILLLSFWFVCCVALNLPLSGCVYTFRARDINVLVQPASLQFSFFNCVENGFVNDFLF